MVFKITLCLKYIKDNHSTSGGDGVIEETGTKTLILKRHVNYPEKKEKFEEI